MFKIKKMKVGKENIVLLTLFSVIAVMCFFLFIFKFDITITAANSYALLEGHFKDFYDYNITTLGHETVYGIFIYIIFAIWNIIPFLFGVRTINGNLPLWVVYWNKLFLLVALCACAFLIYKIAIRIKFNVRTAITIVIAFLTMPLLFFLVNIQASYDILYVFFLLLGYLSYLEEINSSFKWKYNLFFGLSICIKPFALFYYLPLLLLCDKKVKNIIVNCFVTLIPYGLFQFLFLGSSAFEKVITFNVGNIGALFNNSSQFWTPFIFGYIVLCAYSYWKEKDEDDQLFFQDTIMVCNFTSFVFIGFAAYHPQWIMSAIPFWVLAAYHNKRHIGYMLCMLILTCSYYVLFSLQPEVCVDERMFYLLPSKGIGELSSATFKLSDIYKIDDIRIPYTIVSGMTFVLAIFSHRKFNYKSDELETIDLVRNRFERRLVSFVSFVGIMAYVVPTILCWYPPSFFSRTLAGWDISSIKPNITTPWVDSKGYSEYIYSDKQQNVEKIELFVTWWDKQYDDADYLYIDIYNDKNEHVCNKSVLLSDLTNSLVEIPVNLEFEENKWYRIDIRGCSDNEEDLVALGVYDNYDPEKIYMTREEIICPQVVSINVIGTPK